MILRLCLALICLSAWTPPSWAQPDRDRIIRELTKYHAEHPTDPLFFQQTEHTESAQGSGGDAQGHGDGTKQVSSLQTPTLALPGGGSGGTATTTSNQSAFVFGDMALKLLVGGAGVLCLLGAGLCVFVGWGVPRAPAILGGLGLGLIIAAFFPVVVVFVLVAAVAVLVVHAVMAERKGTSFSEALRAVVAGVAAAPSDAAAVVKAEVAKQADARDSAVISTVKLKDRL